MTIQSRDVAIVTVEGEESRERSDSVAIEEPLEIRVRTAGGAAVSVAITMRTPGSDPDLAAGFLWGEGILTGSSQVLSYEAGGPAQPGGFRNIILLTLDGDELPAMDDSARRFYMTSSCGVCGKASLEAIESRRPFELVRNVPVFNFGTICTLPNKLRAAQETFDRTGGLHAAGLFDEEGTLLGIREDVGRHNAVDKLVGSAVRTKSLPLSRSLVFVSGRASFELVQKAVMAGIPALASVGAPSSLAVSLARDAGLTLLGFVRGERFNIYAGEDRIKQL
ncbi:MAG: formate dehydrogenase accessory sulfurtransferase FdhD [Akkermansiaceae bacterium]|nr:formate dehydrogenase accessory sulfurtransferase FdhD [Armatimonadota bacterium]